MTARLPDPMSAFLAHARFIAFQAADHGQWSLYERLKSMLVAQFPGIDSREYERVPLKLQRIAGV